MGRADIAKGWLVCGVVFLIGWSIQGLAGVMIYRQAPPIPTFVYNDGENNTKTELYTQEQILEGQQVWQSTGGQQMGSVWGHGSLQAPDWSADWLHREALLTIDLMMKEENNIQNADAVSAAYIRATRNNTYEEDSNTVWLPLVRVRAVKKIAEEHFLNLFTNLSNDTAFVALRKDYNMKENTIIDVERAKKLCAFIFWSAWATATERYHGDTDITDGYGAKVTYTNNWPHEPLVGNTLPANMVMWTFVSVMLLLAAIGGLAWVQFTAPHPEDVDVPETDPMLAITVTPSMRAIVKWVWTVFALAAFQVLLGYYVAHLSIDANPNIPSFFRFPDWMTQNITYSVARTWHLQCAVFMIAASFLGAGLFLAPVIGKRDVDPPYQLLLSNILYVCVLIIVVGSLLGEVAAVHQWFASLDMSYWFGHQGYEYVDLGRFWQVFLTIGILIWLGLLVNAIWPALISSHTGDSEHNNGMWHLTMLITITAVLIGTIYATGLLYGSRTNLSIMEYWRWWIVHIWVEGVFEVFATVIIAYLFSKMRLLNPESAASAALFSSAIFMGGGLPGMFHHLYFCGTSLPVMAIGATFSALEVVPLTLVGKEVAEYMHLTKAKLTRKDHWLHNYSSLVNFFISVAFWNFMGAGVLGFAVNPPAALYYNQGTYMTLAHAHGSLWGVYGVLGMGLCLLVLRLDDLQAKWNTWHLDFGLKMMNWGMGLQLFMSVLPVGFLQFWTCASDGYWAARSRDFHYDSKVQSFKFARMGGDILFGIGLAHISYFVFKLAINRHRMRAANLYVPLLMK